jgi:hypothetical protein
MLFKYRGYWELKEKALDRTLQKTGLEGAYGLVVRHTRELMY